MTFDKDFLQQSNSSSSSYKIENNDFRVHKPYDKYFKNLMSIAGEGFMKLMGFPIKIKQFHNAEKINEISVFKETGLETIVIVISLDAKEDSDELFGFGEYFNKDSGKGNSLKIEYGFTPHVKSLTSMNLSLYLNIIEKIVRNNEKPDEYALAILFSIPFMTDDVEEKKKLILKTADLASKLNIEDIGLFIAVVNNQRLLAQTVLDKDEFKQFMRFCKMFDELDLYKLDMYEKQVLEELAWKEGREIGIKEGRVEGRVEGEKKGEKKGVEKTACNMLEKGFSLDEASLATGLSSDYITKLCNSK
ncbi:hypothetical protein [uncultured Methanobrevibacter sp.]|uniref:hypothetical protein n=1 Tax=uncultured Methanobrevibacter sp. TaxID=253161 RepID=UPI0025CF0FAC|nr:hypothetical protein [uncultured Methanobrevibacter sp.]